MRKVSTPTISRLPITKARINLGQLAKRAHNQGEYFILEKDGIPVIGIMSADELEDYLELRDPKVNAAIARSRKEFDAGKGRPVTKLLSDLKAIATKAKAARPRGK